MIVQQKIYNHRCLIRVPFTSLYANLRNDTVPYRHWSFQTNKNFILKTGSETDCSLLQMLLKISNVAKICNISIIGSVKDSFYLDWAGGWGGGWVLSWHWMWSHAAGYCVTLLLSRVTRHASHSSPVSPRALPTGNWAAADTGAATVAPPPRPAERRTQGRRQPRASHCVRRYAGALLCGGLHL